MRHLSNWCQHNNDHFQDSWADNSSSRTNGRQRNLQALKPTSQAHVPSYLIPEGVRLRIYGHLQRRPLSGFFELSERSCEGSRPGQYRDGARNCCHAFMAQRCLFRLMRTCKMVHKEVVELLYSSRFRFIGEYGLWQLSSWLYTIQPSNMQRLRHITVQLPLNTRVVGNKIMRASHINVHEYFYTGESWRQKWKRMATRRWSRMRVPGQHHQVGNVTGNLLQYLSGVDASVALVMEYLAFIPELQTLEVIVPRDYLNRLSMPAPRPGRAWTPSPGWPCGSECSTPGWESYRPSHQLSAQDACHIVEVHCERSELWQMLARLSLQQRAASRKLQICLLLDTNDPTPSEGSYSDKRSRLSSVTSCFGVYALARGYYVGSFDWAPEQGCYVITPVNSSVGGVKRAARPMPDDQIERRGRL